MEIPRRFVIMFCICVFTITFFCQSQSPGAIQSDLMRDLQLTSGQYSGLFSVTSWAASLDLLNSYIIEKWWGLKLATYIYIIISLMGTIIYSSASFINSFWLMILGRIAIGIGGNPMLIITNLYVIHWFQNKDINFMFSVMSAVAWLGSSCLYFISIHILEGARSLPGLGRKTALAVTITSVTVAMYVSMSLSLGVAAWLYPGRDSDAESHQRVEQGRDIREKTTIRRLFTFRCIFWVFSITAFLHLVCVMSFIAFSQEFFMVKYGLSVEEASNLSGLFNLLAFALTPLVGYSIDLVGRNLLFFSAGVMLGLLAHLLLGFTTVPPLVPVVILSVSAALTTCSWSMYHYLVEDYQHTIAYGVAQTGSQISIAVGSVCAGYVVQNFGYFNLETFYVVINLVAALLLLLLWPMDYSLGQIITLSAQQIHKRKGLGCQSDNSVANQTPQTDKKPETILQ